METEVKPKKMNMVYMLWNDFLCWIGFHRWHVWKFENPAGISKNGEVIASRIFKECFWCGKSHER